MLEVWRRISYFYLSVYTGVSANMDATDSEGKTCKELAASVGGALPCVFCCTSCNMLAGDIATACGVASTTQEGSSKEAEV